MNIIYVLDVAKPHSSLGIIFRFDSSASVQHFFSPVVLLYWIRIQVLCSASSRLYMHAPCCNGVRQPTTTLAAIQPQCNRSTTRTECQVQWHSLIQKKTHTQREHNILPVSRVCLSLSLFITVVIRALWRPTFTHSVPLLVHERTGENERPLLHRNRLLLFAL